MRNFQEWAAQCVKEDLEWRVEYARSILALYDGEWVLVSDLFMSPWDMINYGREAWAALEKMDDVQCGDNGARLIKDGE